MASVQRTFNLVISPDANALAVTTTSLADGQVGDDTYSQALMAANGAPPYVWSATGLPDGLAIDFTTGTITGDPTTAGTYSVTVTANDTASGSASVTLPLVILAAGLRINGLTLQPGHVGEPYPAIAFTGNGGAGTYHWTATNLPDGMFLDEAAGALFGTPTTAQVRTIVVTLTDSATPTAGTVQRSFPISILAGYVAPTIITTALPTAYVGEPYSTAIATQDGRTPFLWSADSLPDGLTIDPTTGVIAGIPTTVVIAAIVVHLTDDFPTTVAASLTLDVQLAPPVETVAGLIRLTETSRVRDLEDLTPRSLEPAGTAPPPTVTPVLAIMGKNIMGDGSIMGPPSPFGPPPPPPPPPLPEFIVAIMGKNVMGDGSVMGSPT